MDLSTLDFLLHQPPKIDNTSFAQDFKKNQTNIEICKLFLEDPNCKKDIQIFLSSSILHILTHSSNIQEIEKMYTLSEWCIDIFYNHGHNFINNIPVVKIIAEAFGFLLNRLWGNEMNERFNRTSILKDSQFHAICQLNLLNETVLMFSKTFKERKNKQNRAPNFEKYITILFDISTNYILQNLDNNDIVNLALQIVRNCILFGIDFTEIDDIKKLATINIISYSKDIISQEENIQLLFDICFQIKEKHHILEIISCILSLSNSSFPSHCFYSIMNVISNGIDNLLQNFLKPDNIFLNGTLFDPFVFALSQLLVSFARKINNQFIVKISSVSHIFSKYYDFTIFILNTKSNFIENQLAFWNIMKFWSILSFSAKNCLFKFDDENNETVVTEKLCFITRSYIIFLLAILKLNIPEIIDLIIFQSDTIEPFTNLISCNPTQAIPMLFDIFKETNDQLSLALYLKISERAMIPDPKIYHLDETKRCQQILFEASLNIIKQTQEYIHDGNESIVLEYSVLCFIQNVKRFGTEFSITEFGDIFAKRIILSIQNFGNIEYILSSAIKSLKSLTHQFSLVNEFNNSNTFLNSAPTECIISSEYSDELIRNCRNDQFITFLNDQNNIKQKITFLSIIYSLAGKYQKINLFFHSIDEMFDNDNFNEIIIEFIAILKSGEKYAFNTILFYLFPNKVQYILQHCENYPDIMLILKMWQEFLKQNISFSKYSADGIILFKVISFIIKSSINLFISNISIDSDQYDIKMLIRIYFISSRILNNSYVMFDAFKIYNDPILINLLNDLLSIMISLKLQMIFEYPKLLNVFVSFLSSLVYHISSLPKQMIEISFSFFSESLNYIPSKSTIFDDITTTIREFVSKINSKNPNDTRDDIEELKISINQNLQVIFCKAWEIIIETKNYNLVELIKQLFIFNFSFSEILENVFNKYELCTSEFEANYQALKNDLHTSCFTNFGIIIQFFVEHANRYPNKLIFTIE